MFCLNLPPHLRYKPENVFIAGITPGPQEPSVIQINNILRPLIAELREAWNGLEIMTRDHHRFQVRAALIALTSDLPATRKVAGFGSHSAKFFCSHCYLTKSDIGSLHVGQWPRRNYERHRSEATFWLSHATNKDREHVFSSNGVRWSILLDLPYWDPTKMVSVDIMHNISGIVDYHVRNLLGINLKDAHKRARRGAKRPFAPINDADMAMSMELDSEEPVPDVQTQLQGESEWHDDDVDVVMFESTAPPLDEQLIELLFTIDEDENEERHQDTSTTNIDSSICNSSDSFLTPEQICALRHVISSITAPTWVERPPPNLGEAQHGKLKAIQWIHLITIFLPLASCDLFGFETAQASNLFHLVSFVNLVFSHEVRSVHLRMMVEHLIAYLSSSKDIFPHFKMRPNHHMALHLAEVCDMLGPLPFLAVFAGERTNYQLKLVPTNSRPGTLKPSLDSFVCSLLTDPR